jgi:tetratricopeptide (TPR) repeat protein
MLVNRQSQDVYILSEKSVIDWITVINEDMKKEDYAKMIADAQEALKVFPDNVEFISRLGFAYFLMEDYKNAIVYFEKTIKQKPDYPTASMQLGMAYYLTGDYDNAEKVLKQGLSYFPDNELMQKYLAYTLEKKKNKAGLAPDLSRPNEEMAEKYPEVTKALLLIQSGKWEEGLAIMKQLAYKDKVTVSGHLNYGSMLFEYAKTLNDAGQKDKALPYFQESKDELLKAIDFANGAAGENPLKSQACFLVGDLYFFIFGDKILAKEYYMKALDFDNNHPGAIEALEKLFNK